VHLDGARRCGSTSLYHQLVVDHAGWRTAGREGIVMSQQRVNPGPDAASGLDVEVRWEKPVVAVSGGNATLSIQLRAREASARGGRRAPIDVAFIVDRSGSMAGEKLALVKEAVNVAAGHLRDADQAALVVYDNAVDTLQPLQPATPRAKTALRLALHGVDAGGSTDLSSGWLTGCGEIGRTIAHSTGAADHPAVRIRRALLLTDGLANGGITDPGEMATHAGELRKRGISTTTLGVGLDFDEVMLSGMAEAGGGNFQFIDAPDQLKGFFERELRELLTIAAAGLTLTLTLPHGVRADLVNALPAERRGKQIEVATGDLPAGDELDLVFALRVAPGAAGATHQLGLDLAWSDPAADARRTRSVDVPPLVLVDDATLDQTMADTIVVERAAVQRATAGRREALSLDRAGRHSEARVRMRDAAAMLQAAPMTARIREDLELTERFAAAPEAPYGAYERKAAAFHNARRTRGKADDPGGEQA
jgi:Ca-activated chloride channel family protein